MLDRLTVERLAAEPGPVVVALSGGGDSLALLHLLVDALGPDRLLAACVDHGLRPGSAEDARRAAAMAAGLGVAAERLPIVVPSRSHAAAREARYGALCALARRAGGRVVALGHTRDDQAETVLLRAARGSSWRGLAGMRTRAPAPYWPDGRGVRLARPLLSVRRQALRAFLRARDASWIEDPANDDPAFARVRVRIALCELERAGVEPMRLAAVAERFAPLLAALNAEAAALIAQAVRFDDDAAVIDCAAWAGPASVRARALAALIAAAGGHARGPSLDRAAAFEAQLTASGFRAATLAGAHVVRRGGANLRIVRDAGALRGRADGVGPSRPLPLIAGVETVWDRRLALTAREPGWSVIVEEGAPVLARGEARAPVAVASPRWLLAERVAHWLGLD